MQVYEVGGAVRDALLGLPVNDRDWVVVGATPEEMVRQGFVPVGRDFPVFLHPLTHEEYALARTERKTARGYHGFRFVADPSVTLEQDLARRDLTINAIARDPQGRLIDPHGGQRDLQDRVLRHVTEAFREDPVRILRVARFAARFVDFTLAPDTLALMRGMVAGGEVDALVPERVWQELARGLMEQRPSRMLQVLDACGAWARLLPGLDAGAARGEVVDAAARIAAALPVRYACMVQVPGDPQAASARVRAISQRLRVPSDCGALAELVAREQAQLDAADRFDADALVGLLERCDALRKPQRLAHALLARACITQSGQPRPDSAYAPRARVLAALAAARAVDTAQLAAQATQAGASGPAVGAWIRRARVEAVARVLDQDSKASAA